MKPLEQCLTDNEYSLGLLIHVPGSTSVCHEVYPLGAALGHGASDLRTAVSPLGVWPWASVLC